MNQAQMLEVLQIVNLVLVVAIYALDTILQRNKFKKVKFFKILICLSLLDTLLDLRGLHRTLFCCHCDEP